MSESDKSDTIANAPDSGEAQNVPENGYFHLPSEDYSHRPGKPYLDSLLRYGIPKLKSFPSVVLGRPVGTDVESVSESLRNPPFSLHPDYLAITEVNPPDDPWLDRRVLNVEYGSRLYSEWASRTLLRHKCGIQLSMEGNTEVEQRLVLAGSTIPSVEELRIDTVPGHDPYNVPIVHISEIASTDFSEEDQALAIFKVLRMLMKDGQDEESAHEGVRAVLELPPGRMRAEHMDALKLLACGRPEYKPMIYSALVEECNDMTELEQKEYVQEIQNFTDSLLDIPAIRPHVEKWANEVVRDEGRHEVHVAALLAILRQDDIWLSENQKRDLRALDCAALPAFDVAFHAKDANDFARKAGLTVEE